MEGGLGRFVAEREGKVDLASRLRRAYEVASSLGRLVGRVTRYGEVSTTFSPEVEVEVHPAIYYSMGGLRVGDYLAVVDPKTMRIALGVVVEVRRADELAESGVGRPISPYNGVKSLDPDALMTTPRLRLKLLVEGDAEGREPPVPASLSIDPQSPVFDPRPDVVERLLSLGGGGVTVGALATPAGLVKGGSIAVRLPYKSLLQHILVIGTTGSGKTTLLKNTIAALTSSPGLEGRTVIPVSLDMNEDFIQLPLPGPPGDEIAERVYRGVGPPERVVIVLPVTVDLVDEAYTHIVESGGRTSEAAIIEWIVEEYSRSVIEPLTRREVKWKCVERGGGLVVCQASEAPYTIIPYTINTIDPQGMRGDSLAGLMPGITRLAQDLLKRLREHYRRARGLYPPIQVLLAAAALYLEYYAVSRRSRRQGSLEEFMEEVDDMMQDLVAPHIAGDKSSNLFAGRRVEPLGETLAEATLPLVRLMEKAKPHKGSVEALYRKLQALAESGVVDVALSLPGIKGGVVKVLSEPPWRLIVAEAASTPRPSPIVVDLHWPSFRSGGSLWTPRLIAYRVLERLIAWKHEEWASRRRGAPDILVIVDEAHQFFPQEKGSSEEAEANRQVAAMISRLARLGRARGVGIVFSTHSPSDLHDIILQLANTKIVLRTERSHAEKVGVPSELRDMLPYMADRYMVVMSHVFRGGYVIAATARPLTMHYDLSAPHQP